MHETFILFLSVLKVKGTQLKTIESALVSL
jgi:hypothetical protein